MFVSNFEKAVLMEEVLKRHLDLDPGRRRQIRAELMDVVNMEDGYEAFFPSPETIRLDPLEAMEMRLMKQIFRVSLTLFLLLLLGVIWLLLAV